MLSHVCPSSEASARQNLRWLFILRNLMVFSEGMLVFLSSFVLNIHLPQHQLWLVLLLLGALNIYTSGRLESQEPISEIEIFIQITLDVMGIAGLLYFTGGASNPLTWVFLLPVIIATIMLPQSYSWYMVILTASMYTVLIAYNVPLPSIEPYMADPRMPHSDMQHAEPMMHAHEVGGRNYFSLHLFGMWFGFVFSAGLVAYFVAELANTLKIQERRLAEARESALRDERVVSLGTLAASAAHDMGTPLATITILAHELEQEFPLHRFPDLHEKTLIIQQQIERCKEALSVMSASAGEMRAESGKAVTVVEYLDHVINQWRTHKPGAKLSFFVSQDVVAEAKIIAERTLTHSIINILNNAAEASPTDKGVEFHARWDRNTLNLLIRDYGPGLPPELLEFGGTLPVVSKKHGLGVGLFLTYSTIRRLGGSIHLYNIEPLGASVEISLPLFLNTGYDDDCPRIG